MALSSSRREELALTLLMLVTLILLFGLMMLLVVVFCTTPVVEMMSEDLTERGLLVFMKESFMPFDTTLISIEFLLFRTVLEFAPTPT